jgi:hypothetical protein
MTMRMRGRAVQARKMGRAARKESEGEGSGDEEGEGMD